MLGGLLGGLEITIPGHVLLGRVTIFQSGAHIVQSIIGIHVCGIQGDHVFIMLARQFVAFELLIGPPQKNTGFDGLRAAYLSLFQGLGNTLFVISQVHHGVGNLDVRTTNFRVNLQNLAPQSNGPFQLVHLNRYLSHFVIRLDALGVLQHSLTPELQGQISIAVSGMNVPLDNERLILLGKCLHEAIGQGQFLVFQGC